MLPYIAYMNPMGIVSILDDLAMDPAWSTLADRQKYAVKKLQWLHSPQFFLLFGQLLESPGQGCLAVHDPSQLKKMNPDN